MARDRKKLEQALAHLNFWHQHINAAGSHYGRNRELSDRLLECAIESGIQADLLRGDLTWEEVLRIVQERAE